MAVIDVSRQRRSLLQDAVALELLPPELITIIQDETSTQLLGAIAEAALIPTLTERLFVHFEATFPDICARWVALADDESKAHSITSSLARILPFAPYLSAFIADHDHGVHQNTRPSSLHLKLPNFNITAQDGSTVELQRRLLTGWRLINFDSRAFGRIIAPASMQVLFSHTDRAVRYLAVRIYCRLLRAADLRLELLLKEHVGSEDAIPGDFDGIPVDFGFLSLYEQQRVKRVLNLRQQAASPSLESDSPLLSSSQTLTDHVAVYGNAILPRPLGPTGEPPSLVMTSTTSSNLEALARLLRASDPVMLHGLPGVGKTSLIHEIARDLGMYSSMVTLHLNEQTDAKMLVGLYSTDSKPGSFQWRPGVLTTAVKEGRWVLVEDLDRAPTEVLSTLLPLIERKELLIPSRGEKIRAAKSFRLFATLRTTQGLNGKENLPALVGMRFWQTLHVAPIPVSEVEQIIVDTYPVLNRLVTGILAVFKRLSSLSTASGSRTVGRPITMRDLLKWCRRLQECLYTAGSRSGDEPITETTRDWMFLEAVDCFVGSFPDHAQAQKLSQAIAEEMHISKDRADHYVTANIPPLEENETRLSIGRARLKKNKFADRMRKSKRPFASTTHAKRLLEQIAVAVKMQEPVLLVGETGIGKTTVVQQLAETLGHKLIAVNLSQQSEVGDLLGGFKPVNARNLAVPIKEEFEDLFSATGISATKNQKYLEQVGKCFAKGQWARVTKLWREAPKMFSKILAELERRQDEQLEGRNGDVQPAKRRKTGSKLESLAELQPRWNAFAQSLDQFDIQTSGGSGSFAFSFVEGNLVKALRNGDWVLLDEINLASPDTLESIADLLTGPAERPSILLSETGEIEKIVAHPNFRIFGAMNPATDVGKRDLPVGIRSRFTELYVRSPDTDLKDLLTIIKTYLGSNAKNDQAADDIARLYLNTKRMAEEKRLVDGANEVPHFSLRTLTRVLTYVNTIASTYGLRRALYEGFSMGFLTLLSRDSEAMLVPLIHHHLFDRQSNSQSLMSQAPKHPNDGKEYVKFRNKARDRQYWLFQGQEQPVQRDDYVITPYVERNLLNLVRATSTRKFPILIQGPTSAGKTSMIEYLAHFTGNKFVRINNHEHTDLQEYLGTYVSGSDGKLKFQEGLLVQAMRQGHWIVLDELNLAPTDVLEALNRLLDDNRELLIPETQEVVKPHENFILFATQNPPGLYGGRKALSRAFRNRFLELHFDDIPEDELEFILQQRSVKTSPPDCRRIVTVYKELSRLRQTSRLFEQKDSFATLRDLFRWALREASTREEIAAHGFMLLAERVRNEEERLAVKEIIEKVFKVKIDIETLYAVDALPELKSIAKGSNTQGVVWTHAMRRLYILVAQALRNKEPVLLVGDTGCGKTTVCQLLAEALGKELHIVNAHQNTETGDLIGSQRPVRNRGAIVETLEQAVRKALSLLGLPAEGSLTEVLEAYKALDAESRDQVPLELRQQIVANEARSKALFEWADGSLVEAMRRGQYFLLDEISLADDSVLERLNSVLEPSRTLLLAEKGIDDSLVVANNAFQFFATMNPGGDFGKKELSPALRNRFTEIWVPPLSGSSDMHQIVESKLKDGVKNLTDIIIQFAAWFGATFRPTAAAPFSVREILVWVQFINTFEMKNPSLALLHGASTVFIDSLGANPSALLAIEAKTVHEQRKLCVGKLGELAGQDFSPIYEAAPNLTLDSNSLVIGDFSISRLPSGVEDAGFAFHAPTTRLNAMRVIRALQMQKPILLEGNPGVGKTTLVAALAQACGQPLTRINLSDQTDLMDLFGTDVPVEGAEAGNFAWRDAPFLQAMQKGEWVLLDEMNLASQSVLEGLNACLDHRGEVYISELDQVFKRHPNFRLFAAQNPHHQGGGRKGLPSSFVNRFIVVYADTFTEDDLVLIASHNFSSLPKALITQLIRFVSQMEHQLTFEKSFGSHGGPWEFNLRDVLRWLKLLTASDPLLRTGQVDDYLDIVVRQRFRTQKDREHVNKLYEAVMDAPPKTHSLYHTITSRLGQVGLAALDRNDLTQPESFPTMDQVPRLQEIESLMICVKQNIPCILSGPSGVGKTVLLEHLAAVAGKSLVVFPINADVDTMDLIGGFEQADPLRQLNAALKELHHYLQDSVLRMAPGKAPETALDLIHLLETGVQGESSVAVIKSCVQKLLSQVPHNSEVAERLSITLTVLEQPLVLSDPRFEWLDGIIVKALEAGEWLVLDNANMCNASVLDRLNSLLEPNGFLSINEHCGPDGEPRIVRPHPDFRIFLTTDPRYGELSRAMRNRSVEIFIETTVSAPDPSWSLISPVECSLGRYSRDVDINSEVDPTMDLRRISLDHLQLQDLTLLTRYQHALEFIGVSGKEMSAIESFLHFVRSPAGGATLSSVSTAYDMSEISKSPLVQTMAIHPLNNSPVSCLLAGDGETEWLAADFEFRQTLHEFEKFLSSQQAHAQTSKLTNLTRFQRSLVSDQVAAVSKDSTVHMAKFLSTVIESIGELLNIKNAPGAEIMHRTLLMRTILGYLDRTVRLADDAQFSEAEFQGHLAHGSNILGRHLNEVTDPAVGALAAKVLDQLDRSFSRGFKLTTGTSMERLWAIFRPILVSYESTLLRLLRVENLAAKFDQLRWRTNSSLASLSKALSTLQNAYIIARSNDSEVDDLVQGLEDALSSLESQTPVDAPTHEPYLVKEFDTLRQLSVLRTHAGNLSERSDELPLLALSNLPSRSTLMYSAASGHALDLQVMDYLTAAGQQVWDGKLGVTLWAKLSNMEAVSLGSLSLLEAELPILGRQLVRSAEDIIDDSLLKLNSVLVVLLRDLIAAYTSEPVAASLVAQFSDLSDEELTTPISSTGTSCVPIHNILQIVSQSDMRFALQDHIIPAFLATEIAKRHHDSRTRYSALAWIHFAVGAIRLYVPDKMFDPEIRPRMERDLHREILQTLDKKIAELQGFEIRFTGQNTSKRIQLLQNELLAVGPLAPEILPVYRPQNSSLGKLQAEFSNIVKLAASPTIKSILKPASIDNLIGLDEVQLLKGSVSRLLDRLTSSFKEYQDITQPAANLLRCLDIGLSLTEADVSIAMNHKGSDLMQGVPFFGPGHNASEPATTQEHGFDQLALMSASTSILGLGNLSAASRQSILQCFHAFYQEWQKKLETDRKAEEAKTSLYRFRGSAEDEEEMDEAEFHELFPGYDDETVPQATKPMDEVWDSSQRVAKLHSQVFGTVPEPVEAIEALCKAAAEQLSRDKLEQSFIARGHSAKLLAPLTRLINEKQRSLTTSATTSDYNFYTDSNLPEVRQLVGLAQKIRARFRELQLVDDIGHMQPLADVISACDKLFELMHTEALAKILPKVESLHAILYEWQFGGWASKIHGSPALYDALTETIVRWRRAELSTWAKLFDMELAKCKDDARSWWFIAYQVVVAMPLSLIDSPKDLQAYTVQLIENLQLYFSTSIIGQFQARIDLLSQLVVHLRLFAQDYGSLKVIIDAVSQFITFYQRYAKTVADMITKGRAPIEKKMKDVLLMASWKDTNINALRESARRSHQKLFRLVRKFRAVLGQEMKTVIDPGLPDEHQQELQHSDQQNDAEGVNLDPGSVAAVESALPTWGTQNKRLSNTTQTVSVMHRVSKDIIATTDVSTMAQELIDELNASVAELRKETPSTPTEENKSLIKHLKTRKSKLFSDTLRNLRNMGLQHNLGQDRLAKQNSIAMILSTMPTIQLNGTASLSDADYFMSKILDLMPKVRDSARDHSEDLTPDRVGRSIGFAEGVVYLLLTQRKRLSVAAGRFISLEHTLGQLAAVSALHPDDHLSVRKTRLDWQTKLPWLEHMLHYAVKLVETHCKLGGVDDAAISEQLRNWAQKIGAHRSELGKISSLPAGLTSDRYLAVEKSLSQTISTLSESIQTTIVDSPAMSYIFNSLLTCTNLIEQPLEAPTPTENLQDLADASSTICNKVLVAIERVQQAAKAMPSDDKDPDWLVKQSDTFLALSNALHMPTVDKGVADCIRALEIIPLSSPAVARAAVGIMNMLGPILHQYAALCRNVLGQFCAHHRATAYMGHNLIKLFLQLSSQGFCTPQEKSDETSGAEGKLESGTGLGDGEGAEDISKDIQPDEDLTELAQEANKESGDDVEDEKDAVDMGDQELEGDMGSVAGEDEEDEGKDGEEREEGEDEMDEEAGEVDDLDPTAVDEKMWDGDDEEAEKDQQGDKAKGQKKDDEQMASDEQAKENKNQGDDPEEPDQNETEAEGVQEEDENVEEASEMNRQEQTAEDNDALALPEELDLQLDEEASDSDDEDMNMLSDVEDEKMEEETQPATGKEEDDVDGEDNKETAVDADVQEAAEPEDDEGQEDEGKDDGQATDELQEEDEDMEPTEDPAEVPDEDVDMAPPSADQGATDLDNAAPSDVKGSGEDQDADAQEQDKEFQSNAANQEEGKKGDAAADQAASAGQEGKTARRNEPMDAGDAEQEAAESAAADPFKKLGDALEQWHRQKSEIKQADVEDEAETKNDPTQAQEQSKREFQHLQNDEDAADAQAMGTADEDQVQPIDETMGIEDEKEDPSSRLLDETKPEDQVLKDAEQKDEVQEEPQEAAETMQEDGDDGRAGVKTRQGNYQRESTPMEEEAVVVGKDEDETIEETSTQLSTTHISDERQALREYDEAARQWSEFQGKTHSLSLSLTSQLRLILNPSQTTKLSGSFRTGKRLNIKRIIPYIASSYKRDKIWMRRAIPTKRTYQILLCVDDSKSMGESSSGKLAMESLVMVARSLTMLEAGQVGVMGFGGDVFAAHALTEPFASDAGAKILQNFTFAQDRTDVALLVRHTIDTFKAARQQTSGGAADLWQLALILSDGLTPSSAHDSIRRLLREAIEERIMIVFIIMDDTGKKKGDSVLELKEAKFVSEGGESRVVIERYLDTFPFQYYLIVHNLEDLPNALAGLLRTWFAEVNA